MNNLSKDNGQTESNLVATESCPSKCIEIDQIVFTDPQTGDLVLDPKSSNFALPAVYSGVCVHLLDNSEIFLICWSPWDSIYEVIDYGEGTKLVFTAYLQSQLFSLNLEKCTQRRSKQKSDWKYTRNQIREFTDKMTKDERENIGEVNEIIMGLERYGLNINFREATIEERNHFFSMQ